MAAHDISVLDTLGLLDGPFAEMANAISRAQYALWLGSGISRERVADLRVVIKRVLIHLHERIDPNAPDCPFRQALGSVLNLAQLSDVERNGFDPSAPIDDWPILNTILQRLTTNYATLLDVTVPGRPADYLLWEAVDVIATFAPPDAVPDCEHLCVAILALEGVVPEIATANWDGLIEAAVRELTDGSPDILRVCVRGEDFREARLRTRLVKFHGCAVRALADPATYRSRLVARQSQITGWPHDPVNAVMLADLVTLAVTVRTLMVGLSAQDTDIQDIFARAQAMMQWPWPSDPPANVFAEDSLGTHQRNVLRSVYREAYTPNAAAIDASALFRAYAKPLLVALVLHVLASKFRTFIDAANAPGLQAVDRSAIADGVRHLRDRVAALADDDRLAFIRSFATLFSRGLSLFREGRTPAVGSRTYYSFSADPIHLIPASPGIQTSGLRECASAIGLLGRGDAAHGWNVRAGLEPDGSGGVLTAGPDGQRARVFFAANNDSGLGLEVNGLVAEDHGDAIVVHSTTYVPRQPRSPRAAPGRTGHAKPRHVNMRDILSEATSLAELETRFREEAAL